MNTYYDYGIKTQKCAKENSLKIKIKNTIRKSRNSGLTVAQRYKKIYPNY